MINSSGGAGNMGVFVGEDGVLLVDDQFAPFTDAICTAIKSIGDKLVKFLQSTSACLQIL